MDKQFEHNGHKYWVRIEPAVHGTTGEIGFIAYVKKDKPGAFLWGESVKDAQGRVIFFKSELAALTNANAIMQSELEGKQVL